MNNLPIVHITLYKHGVGYFRRRGSLSGTATKLTFRREEMADLLKSLTVIDYGGGQVLGIDYDTPQSDEERLAGCSILLNDRRSLRDLLLSLRGRAISLSISNGDTETGLLVGLDEDTDNPLTASVVSLLRNGSDTVANFPLERVEGIALRDETAAADLRFFLQTALGQETHRSITIRLSPGDHDLEVSYIAPAPTWRVSYRLVTSDGTDDDSDALLQGWGIFDNQLEEDLADISLSLTAGMPISFRYDLYTPRTPVRPVVEEENRTAAAPIMFGAAQDLDDAEGGLMDAMMASPPPAAAPQARARGLSRPAPASMGGRAEMSDSVPTAAKGEALGELFQYRVSTPVTVGRGQSAMVPIVSSTLGYQKNLIYNGGKMPTHPVATLRFKNTSGLTLERGPVTVLENGEYVGEAILPFTTDQAEAVISYAVELGIHIKEDLRTETQLQTVYVKDKYLLQDYYHQRYFSYQIENRTAQPKTVLIEHPINTIYDIYDTPTCTEQTADFYRYSITAEANKTTLFKVKERRLQTRSEKILDLSYKALQSYFDDKFLTRAIYMGLRDILDAWEKLSQLSKDIIAQEKRREEVYRSQEQIQKNMRALSQTGEEGRLRGRYVKQLTETEEALSEIETTIAKLKATRAAQEAQVHQMIAALGSKA